MAAMGAEAIFAAEEPSWHPIVAERPIRLHKKDLPLVLAAMSSFKALLSGRRGFLPIVRIVSDSAPELEIGIDRGN